MTYANKSRLKAVQSGHSIAIYREGVPEPIVTQHAERDRRPFIHPIVAPDGNGILTEDAPPHHPWQHGLYIGLNDVNGVGFWEEGLRQNPLDGTFHPMPLEPAEVNGNQAAWTVRTDWRAPDGSSLFEDKQRWTLRDSGTSYELDLDWTITASTDLIFGKYAYGGLFLRMPFRKGIGGNALNSEGLPNTEGEGQRARWVAVAMPIEGRDDQAGMAMMDHPDNMEHPVPWRVDGQLGVSPSCCIAGEWRLRRGESRLLRHRVLVFCGNIRQDLIESSWRYYSGRYAK